MPSPSTLTLGVSSVFLSLFSAVAAQSLSYRLIEDISGARFFDHFNFFTDVDPTHGYVKYLSQNDATVASIININPDGSAYMGVDHTNTYSSSDVGRPSVRISTKNSYTHGLFIADIAHMPSSTCGVWPAFWSLGSGDWPNNGEIDIIEGANKIMDNYMSLHTSKGCSVAGNDQTGTLLTNVCDADSSSVGCSTQVKEDKASFGDAFNSNQGGVYAMQWMSEGIKIWFFPRHQVPDSITSGGVPNVHEFGLPDANFMGSCDFDSHFSNHSFIFDTTFCGDWAGRTWQQDGCPMAFGADTISSCVSYVGQNPSQFSQAFWNIKALRIYEEVPPVSTSSVAGVPRTLVSSVPLASTAALPLTTLMIGEGRPTTADAIAAFVTPSVNYGAAAAAAPAAGYGYDNAGAGSPGYGYGGDSTNPNAPGYGGDSAIPNAPGYGYEGHDNSAAVYQPETTPCTKSTGGYSRPYPTPAPIPVAPASYEVPAPAPAPAPVPAPAPAPAQSAYNTPVNVPASTPQPHTPSYNVCKYPDGPNWDDEYSTDTNFDSGNTNNVAHNAYEAPYEAPKQPAGGYTYTPPASTTCGNARYTTATGEHEVPTAYPPSYNQHTDKPSATPYSPPAYASPSPQPISAAGYASQAAEPKPKSSTTHVITMTITPVAKTVKVHLVDATAKPKVVDGDAGDAPTVKVAGAAIGATNTTSAPLMEYTGAASRMERGIVGVVAMGLVGAVLLV